MEGSFWALMPTIVAVIMAIFTKQVFVALFAGIFTGAMMIAAGNPINAMQELLNIMAAKMAPSFDADGTVSGLGNSGVLIFIAELGIIVALMNKAGGTTALSARLARTIESSKGVLLATTGLGCMIFMDDYFNRLAVGTIMKPVADKHGVSRIKLAHIIGSVSVSVCLLIPISSWASAITGNISEANGGLTLYLKTLSCNFYPILTLLMLIVTSALGIGLPGMRNHSAAPVLNEADIATKGKSIDFILPIFTLTAMSILLMTLTPIDSETSLAMAGATTIIFCLILYLPRKVMNLKEFTECFGGGFKTVGEVLIILLFAWTLTGVCEKLDVAAFITLMTNKMGSAKSLLPAILFLAAMGTSFATGTAWGTFGILVPLSLPMFEPLSAMQVLTVAAVLSGSVFGNQVSPISDSTILSSNVCECDHITFIKAQLPGALMIAGIAFIAFLIAGLTSLIWLGWVVSLLLFAVLIAAVNIRFKVKKRSLHKSVERCK